MAGWYVQSGATTALASWHLGVSQSEYGFGNRWKQMETRIRFP